MAVDFRQLVDAGVHFGHQTYRWHPGMEPYIWGSSKNKVHLIDVSKTASQIEKASHFLRDVVADGKQVLWIGTKKSAQKVISDVATKLDMPYVNHRWVGGTLSNNLQVKKSLTKWMHLEDVLAKSEKFPFYTKKELNIFKKMVQRLEKSIGGLKKLNLKNLGAIVLVDVEREYSSLLEATGMNIPVVGLVDTNSDPSLVDYVIPANDDSAKSIETVLAYLVEAVEEGAKFAAKKAEEAKAEAAKAKKDDQENLKSISKKDVLIATGEKGDSAEKLAKELRTARSVETTASVAKPKTQAVTKEKASSEKSEDEVKKTTKVEKTESIEKEETAEEATKE